MARAFLVQEPLPVQAAPGRQEFGINTLALRDLRDRCAVNLGLFDHRALLGKGIPTSRATAPSQLVRYHRFRRRAHLILRGGVLRPYLIWKRASFTRLSISAMRVRPNAHV